MWPSLINEIRNAACLEHTKPTADTEPACRRQDLTSIIAQAGVFLFPTKKTRALDPDDWTLLLGLA